MAHLFDLTGKTALVTGGTRGLGAAMAIALAEAGADIILVQRDLSNVETRDSIRMLPNPRQCLQVQCELSDPLSVSSLLPQLLLALSPPVHLPPIPHDKPLLQTTSKLTSNPPNPAIPNNDIHILLNAAGIQARHPSHQYPLPTFDHIIQVNLTTPFHLARDIGNYWLSCVGPTGISLSDRTVINIASLLSFQGGFTVPAYSASKGGLAQVTKALSNEWAKSGIRVNNIAPGYCDTEMNTALVADKEGRARQIIERIPAQRWGTPEDFKGVVVFLASSKASAYVTGETVIVDGGWMAR
ncbi:NAD(P)-binding protein [Terfezia boudieri ATCC MYA-4762]|uniref:NAD(P)-binding protein n=1 Tax=Terfezia boudieri ATCC MYA-4762 TaxID=1051890 RepID=A0A3N4LMG0_9PEZI|nr:NAD(P)-binding protein [Terfezia boudieri ATCC MYA-4762]